MLRGVLAGVTRRVAGLAALGAAAARGSLEDGGAAEADAGSGVRRAPTSGLPRLD